MRAYKKFPNLFCKKGKRLKLYTENLTPGETFFDEPIEKDNNNEYRFFDPRRSKLAAAILKGIQTIGFKEGSFILYLGASHGYTASFISDMIKEKGLIFAIDFAPRVVRDLIFLCEKRKNITPILGDASQPEYYSKRICLVDFIYMDVAQKNQAEIFLKNCKMFLKQDCFAMLAVKSRSIDIAKKPKQVYQEVREKLKKELEIVDFRILDPFEKDHAMFLVKKTSYEK